MAFPFIHPQKLTATAPKRRVWKMKFLFKRRWFQVPAVTFLGEYSNTPYHPILSTGDATPAWYKAVFCRKNLPDTTQSKTKKTFHKKCPSLLKKSTKKPSKKWSPIPSQALSSPRASDIGWILAGCRGCGSRQRHPSGLILLQRWLLPRTTSAAQKLLRASGWKGFWRYLEDHPMIGIISGYPRPTNVVDFFHFRRNGPKRFPLFQASKKNHRRTQYNHTCPTNSGKWRFIGVPS